LRNRRHTLQLITYAVVMLGGLALVVSFSRFNALHEEFIAANFDSVHGARTLLKAGMFLEMAGADLDSALDDAGRRPVFLARAVEHLTLAESYGAEGEDKEAAARAALTAQIQDLRSQVSAYRESARAADLTRELPAVLTAVRQLAKDFGAAELDRWGALSSANTELEGRMKQMRLFIVGSIVIFLLITATLVWTLARTRRAEENLRLAKAEIEAIQQTTLDASASGIAYVDTGDLEHRFVKLTNRQMAILFGYPANTMTGVDVSDLYGGLDIYERFTATLPPRLATGEVVRQDVLMRRHDGERFWCSLSIKAIDPADASRGVVWTCEDISEHKEAEAQLQLAREKAEAASLAKSEFLANMSHELRTPFAGILGLLDLLQRSPLDEAQRRHVGLAHESASQVLSIVNDILDFSKIEAGKLSLDPVDFELRHFFSTIIEAHGAAAERKGLSLTLEFIEPLPDHLEGDPVRLRQIVDNLASNAIKFTAHGEVRVLVDGTQKDAATFSLRVTVSDTGIGIPAEMHDRIFQQFTQADSSTTRRYGGTGLGLAICRQLAALIGGRISLESSRGEGSRFCLEIDLPVAQATTPDHHRASIDVRGAVVLLVDDNATNRSVFAELLAHYGCIVTVAENGEQAIRLAGEIAPDVILMDCQMPVIDGQEATKRIRAAETAGNRVPIIALTAHATSRDRDSSLASGMDDYLPKPVAGDVLIRKIAHWTTRRRPQGTPEALPGQETGAQPSPASPLPQFSGRILLVEDNAAIREATRCLLEHTGCEVIVAEQGQRALDIFDAIADASDFDLVLMDCKMPIMDGLEATRLWRGRETERGLAPTAIIALTASDSAETQQRCRDAGMNGILLKPFAEARLLALLGDWLNRKLPDDAGAQAERRG